MVLITHWTHYAELKQKSDSESEGDPMKEGDSMVKNNRFTWISLATTAVLALVFLFMAIERTMVSSETAATLDTIEKGLDWDEQTPITIEKQTERMEANLEIYRSQTSQRNRWFLLAGIMSVATFGSFVIIKNKI